MSKRYPPRIEAAKRLAEQFDFDAVIVIGFDGSEVFNVFSYGTKKRTCEAAARVSDHLATTMEAGCGQIEPHLIGRLQEAIEAGHDNGS